VQTYTKNQVRHPIGVIRGVDYRFQAGQPLAEKDEPIQIQPVDDTL